MPQKNLLIGITGSVSAKKTIDLIGIVNDTYNIKVICTYEGINYINKNDYRDIDFYNSWDEDREISYHINLSRWADEFIVYPATANFIAKLSNGIADDILTSTALMYKDRIKIFPAMHEEMFFNEATQENLEKLTSRFDIYGPRYGDLDIGDLGVGRLLEPEEAHNTLVNMNVNDVYVISGPTKEYIDDVRYITNSSSGKQGHAIALESHARGFNTTFITSVVYKNVNNINQINFTTTKDLINIIEKIDISTGYLFMPAAISDFIPDYKKGKLHRKHGVLNIKLSPNVDIIKTIKEENPKLVITGFSAQFTDKVDIEKMNDKNIDYLVTNNVSNKSIGFDSDNNEVSITDKNCKVTNISLKNKYLIAKEILDHVIK